MLTIHSLTISSMNAYSKNNYVFKTESFTKNINLKPTIIFKVHYERTYDKWHSLDRNN